MSKNRKQVPLPSREQVLEFIKDSPGRVGKRELARAFGLSGEGKIVLKQIMAELERSGDIERGHGRRFGPYVSHGGINANLPRGRDEIGLEEAVALLAAKAAKQGKAPPKARKPAAKAAKAESEGEAPKKPAAKKAAAPKKAPEAKKAAPKKPAVKKAAPKE